MKKHIPNFITSLNLIAGSISIIAAFQFDLKLAAIMIGIAAVFDFLDGTFARILKASSELGKQLDSLADMISFGLAPGIIMFRLLSLSTPELMLNLNGINVVPYFALLIPVFSALRLANFNIDSRQSDSFIGVPTPMNALIIASLPFIISGVNYIWLVTFVSNSWTLLALTILLSYLLNAEIPLLGLKFKNLNWKDNYWRFILIGLGLGLIIVFQIMAIPMIFVLYIIISLIAK